LEKEVKMTSVGKVAKHVQIFKSFRKLAWRWKKPNNFDHWRQTI